MSVKVDEGDSVPQRAWVVEAVRTQRDTADREQVGIHQTVEEWRSDAGKDTIETMKWTNELFHQFRKYQQISQKLENFLQINIFSVFS